MKKIKKAIITGISGQTGSYMAEFLLEKGIQVVGTVRRTSQPIESNYKNLLKNKLFSIEYLDLSDPHSIESVIQKHTPDYFFNFGASAFVPDSWNSPAYTMQINSISVIHILEAIRKNCPKCRFYEASSSEIFGKVLESPQSEETLPNPRSIYGVSKNAAKDIVRVYRESYNLYAISGILFNHESERRQKFYVTRKITSNVSRIQKSLAEKTQFEPLELGNIEARRDWSHAFDFVDGIWRIMNQDIFNEFIRYEYGKNNNSEDQNHKWLTSQIKEYVLSSGETHTIREFVQLAFDEAGIQGYWSGFEKQEMYLQVGTDNVLMRINPEFYRPAEVELLLGDSSKARKELGWLPKTSFKELVSKMVKYDLDNPDT